MCDLFTMGGVEVVLHHLRDNVDLKTEDLIVQGKSVPILCLPKPFFLPLAGVRKDQKVQVGSHKAHIENFLAVADFRVHC